MGIRLALLVCVGVGGEGGLRGGWLHASSETLKEETGVRLIPSHPLTHPPPSQL